MHEQRQLALLIMAARSTRGAETERTQVYGDYLDHTAYVNNWDLVDVSCGPIVGRYLQARNRAPLRPRSILPGLGAADRHGQHTALPARWTISTSSRSLSYFCPISTT